MLKRFIFIVILLLVSLTANAQANNFTKIDHIKVFKSKRIMEVYYKDKLLKTYKIALGFSPKGHKEREGDGKTPEGEYHISAKYPNSQFHLALKISYPSKLDKENAAKKKVSPGGDILIHGLGKGFDWVGSNHILKDWTLGCVAITNQEIEEIYPAITVGTAISIKP